MNSENECAEPIVAQILILEEIPCFAIFSPTYCMYGAIPRSDYSLAEPAEAPWHWLESEETEVSLRTKRTALHTGVHIFASHNLYLTPK